MLPKRKIQLFGSSLNAMSDKISVRSSSFSSIEKCKIIEIVENQPQFLMINLPVSNIKINLHNIDTIKISH